MTEWTEIHFDEQFCFFHFGLTVEAVVERYLCLFVYSDTTPLSIMKGPVDRPNAPLFCLILIMVRLFLFF